MRTQRLITWICILCIFTAYLSCQRDDYGSLPTPDPAAPGVQVKSSLEGRVLDDQQAPVQGAIIKAGGSTTFTDLNGNFQIKNVSLDQNAGFVKIEKQGYFTGSRTFRVTEGSKHFVSVQLIKKNDAGNFNATAGGIVNVPNGGSIEFEAAGVIDPKTNTAYTGTVSVSAFLIDPTTDNFRELMPGELRGIDENNRQVGLQSYGMIAVEITGAAGEKLQPAPGKPATINFPIPAALQASAPATIAFWSFNDTTGLWKQEGYATKKGGEYCGKTSHFSFWNCDAPFPLISFKAKLNDQSGNPVKFARVIIKTADDANGPSASSFTDSAGALNGLIPSERRLTLTVIGRCNDVIATREIGPFTAATDIGIIAVTLPEDSRVTFTGEIQDCSGAPMQSGYADIGLLGAHERAPIVNGVLNFSFVRCGNNDTKASIRITDVGNSVTGGIKEVNVTGNTADVGLIKVCEGELTEYLIYTMDTESRQFLPPADSASIWPSDGGFHITYSTRDTSNGFYLTFRPNQDGTVFTPGYFYVNMQKEFYQGIQPITLEITEYGAVGEYIAGTFNGSVRAPNQAVLPLTGRFRLKRQE